MLYLPWIGLGLGYVLRVQIENKNMMTIYIYSEVQNDRPYIYKVS
jgi:hypothetical protein